jgi:hypothetical protein
MPEHQPASPHGSAPSADPVAPTAAVPAEVPALPHEPATYPQLNRSVLIDGQEWIAYPSGLGAYGTGHWGLAPVEAIHFARAETPDKPEVEALLTYGRLECLYPDELIVLFRAARTIVRLDQGAAPIAPRRFSLEEDMP